MKQHIAFLRGINVGNIRIKMTDLQRAFEALGFNDVKTYLQTGNVVFSATDEHELKFLLEQKLTQTFRYEAFVLLYSMEELKKIIEHYPFEREETYQDYIIFIQDTRVLEELKTLSENIFQSGTNADPKEIAQIAPDKNALYWKVAKGETLHTAFAKILGKAKYKSTTTTRNLNTLEKMSE
ncbi:MAG: hypothetical protein RLZZ292_3696 [Bacteroidota bacterium]|jgi:uncharacterized protein (DUF1697 family)